MISDERKKIIDERISKINTESSYDDVYNIVSDDDFTTDEEYDNWDENAEYKYMIDNVKNKVIISLDNTRNSGTKHIYIEINGQQGDQEIANEILSSLIEDNNLKIDIDIDVGGAEEMVWIEDDVPESKITKFIEQMASIGIETDNGGQDE